MRTPFTPLFLTRPPPSKGSQPEPGDTASSVQTVNPPFLIGNCLLHVSHAEILALLPLHIKTHCSVRIFERYLLQLTRDHKQTQRTLTLLGPTR